MYYRFYINRKDGNDHVRVVDVEVGGPDASLGTREEAQTKLAASTQAIKEDEVIGDVVELRPRPDQVGEQAWVR